MQNRSRSHSLVVETRMYVTRLNLHSLILMRGFTIATTVNGLSGYMSIFSLEFNNRALLRVQTKYTTQFEVRKLYLSPAITG